MNFLLALVIFGLSFAGMAVGLIIAKKVLQRGCSVSPDDCRCRAEGKDPEQCEYEPTKEEIPNSK